MKPPFFQDDAVTLWNDDARKVLPTLSPGFGLVICDSPWGNADGYGRSALGMRTIRGDDNTLLLEFSVRESLRLMCDRAWIAVFHGFRQAGVVQDALRYAGLELKTVIVWDKGMPGLGEGIRNQYELIAMARKGDARERSSGGNVWQVPRVAGRPAHPNEKPVALIRRLCAVFAPPDGALLSPFAGVGTDLRAAKDCGLKSVGVELEEAYCALAVSRLAQTVLPVVQGALLSGPGQAQPRRHPAQENSFFVDVDGSEGAV